MTVELNAPVRPGMAPAPPGHGGRRAGGRPIRTVVVDDDFRVASLHAAFVEQLPGFEVLGQAHSAAATYDAIARLRPDLLLLDLYLPDQHGLEVLRHLRAPGVADVDVIVVTAANDVASVRAAMQGGALHYLLKPFDFGQLRDRLVAYQALRAQMRSEGSADQQRVDRLFAALGTALGPGGDPGRETSPHTLQAVESLLASTADELSAVEVAHRLGVSRATAQRYLTRLEALGRVVMSPRYGTAGRPEHRYRHRSA